VRVVVAERGLKEGTIEVKWRTDTAAHQVSAATAGDAILAELDSTRKGLAATTVERRLARAAAKGR
jgi:prolyl-tRNA synthetase